MSKQDEMQERRKRTLSGTVADALMHRIVTGEYGVGDRLPTERELSIEFGVNRHAVREALKRLEAIGLVEIRHGSGIFVLRLHFTAGIDVFHILLEADSVNTEFINDVLEFRRHIVVSFMRTAAKKRRARELGRICRLIDDLTFVRASRRNDEEMQRIVESLFEEIVAATHNQLNTLVFVTINKIYDKIESTYNVPSFEAVMDDGKLKKLRDAFEYGKANDAENAINEYLTATEEALAPTLAQMESAKKDAR